MRISSLCKPILDDFHLKFLYLPTSGDVGLQAEELSVKKEYVWITQGAVNGL